MKRTISTFEIVFTIILIIANCVGIGFTIIHRVDKGAGVLTLENYADYIVVSGSLSGFYTKSHDNFADTNYYVTISNKYYLLRDVNITYDIVVTQSFNGQLDSYSLVGQTISVNNIGAGKKFQSKRLDISVPILPNYTLLDLVSIDFELELTVTAISGNYEYRLV